MLAAIKLNIIKNKINDFGIKACMYITPKDISNNTDGTFCPRYYYINKVPFYILCSNKRYSTYKIASYNSYTNIKSPVANYKNKLLDVCIAEGDNIVDVEDIKLEKFLVMQKNNDYLGWHPFNKVIDGGIIALRGNKHCKHYKDNIYYGNKPYVVDVDKLHLFIRIKPVTSNNLTSLIINCTRDNIYNVCEWGEDDKVGSLGFIVKLNNRHEYVYSNVHSKVTRLKYPFLTRDRLNEELFDGYETNYTIDKEIIYIEDNSKLDKYGIKVLDNF